MTPEAALEQLRDIHLPSEQTVAAGLPVWIMPLLTASLIAAYCIWRHFARKREWLHQAQAELQAIARDAQTGNADRGWHRLAVLMRQLAILHNPSAKTASDSASTATTDRAPSPAVITGDAWLLYLDELLATEIFFAGLGRVIISRPYQLNGTESDPTLAALCDEIKEALNTLIKKHKLPKPTARRHPGLNDAA